MYSRCVNIHHEYTLFNYFSNHFLNNVALSLLQQVLICQEIQESDSQHTEFVLLAMNIIPNNDNLTKVVID